MDIESEPAATKKLAALQPALLQHFLDQIAEIEKLRETLQEGDPDNIDVTILKRITHCLGGFAGAFGAVTIELNQTLQWLLNNRDQTVSCFDVLQKPINSLLVELKQAADKLHYSDLSVIHPCESQEQRDGSLIYLLDSEELFVTGLAEELEQAGYSLHHFTELSDFEAASEREIPAAIIMAIPSRNGHDMATDCVTRLQGKQAPCPPVVFISESDDIKARLSAARAGVQRYFAPPFDIKQLIQTLGGMTAQIATTPCRVLLIDTDEALLNSYATELCAAGMTVKTLSNPLEALQVLASFRPDISIISAQMDECSGPELARMIRQDDAWIQMPIMFLSTQPDLNCQLAAMSLGDDFLVKPVPASHLVTAIITRVKRVRLDVRFNNELKIALKENEYQLATLNQHNCVSATDVKGRIIFVNDKFCEISGYSHEELLGQSHNLFSSGSHSCAFFDAMWNTISQGKVWRGTICNHSKDGSEYWVDTTIVPFLDEKGKPYKYVSVRTNITSLQRKIVEEIADSKRRERALIDARDNAEKANRAKSQFLSNMSHELRTPLNAIMGFSQLLKMGLNQSQGDSKQESIDEIIKGSNHLLTLINEVLDLSKIESGHIDLSLETVELNAVIVEAVQLTTPLAQKRGINIRLIQDGVNTALAGMVQQPCVIITDRTRLKQALLNLLSNGIKYNCENGSLTIACQYSENNQVRISITDMGAGLSQRQQKHLFKAFDRLGAEGSGIEGSGLGLVLTKQIIEHMGGAIGVTSHPGKGSTFWIELPGETLNPMPRKKTDNKIGAQSTADASPKDAYSVLYIEDNSTNQRLVAQLLKQRPNVQLRSARDPLLGLELAQRYKPDLILLDINLPGMDDFTVLHQLRLLHATKNIPVIALSASAMLKDIEKGLEAGFYEYITKPIDIKSFLQTIDKLLEEATLSIQES